LCREKRRDFGAIQSLSWDPRMPKLFSDPDAIAALSLLAGTFQTRRHFSESF